ncbi:MAG: hypothetical protein AB1585_19175 [Thermodesulfobacteriota bacterium]
MAIDLSKLTRSSKRMPVPGTKYHWLDQPCPECGGRLYEMEKCCGAPEGWVECSRCMFQEKPKEFYERG